MSCCGTNCNCGSDCKCGSSCGGSKRYFDLVDESGTTASVTMVLGVVPQKGHFRGFEMAIGSENGGCKCGSTCTCDPCSCK